MLSILSGKSSPHRRDVLVAGSLGVAGLNLANLLQAEERAGIRSSVKTIVNIHLDGGPPQMDMIDPKPEAPEEIRGEFRPIATKTSGLFLTELMPKIASISDQCVFLRSLIGSVGAHDGFQCQSGYTEKSLKNLGGRPAFGSVIAKVQATPQEPVPPFVDLMQGRPLVRNSARPGFLGPSFNPFRPDLSQMFPRELEAGMVKELAAKGENHTIQLKLAEGLTPQRLQDRQRLLGAFDTVRRDVDQSGSMEALDQFSQQAVNILTSGDLAKALDFGDESAASLARYTPKVQGGERSTTSEDENSGKKLILVRRLIEAGVRCISVSFSDFDTHSNNFPRMRNLVPIVDHAIHALVSDLTERGLIDNVMIVVWGEFGRSPKVNKNGGRDHWPAVSPAFFFGGGIQGGQVIGATDRTASRVLSRATSHEDVLASMYRFLGINAGETTLLDPNGRPQYLLEHGQPIPELA